MRFYFLLGLIVSVISCDSENTEPTIVPPEIITTTPTNITLLTAEVTTSINHSKPELILNRGICWSKTPSPKIENSTIVESGTGTGEFKINLSFPTSEKFYIRSFAQFSNATFYGNEISIDFNTLIPVLNVSYNSGDEIGSFEIDGSINYEGQYPIIEKGICWSKTSSPTINSSGIAIVSGDELNFNKTISSLDEFTTYYVRGFAKTQLGLFYSQEIQLVFIPTVQYGQVTDIDGNQYKTTRIGTKTWMAENLRVTKYNDGSDILFATNQEMFKNADASAYTTYDNIAANGDKFGYLYNGYVANNNKNVCVEGWHIPSPEEWIELANFLGGIENAGGRMKAVSELWHTPNTGADNASGFSSLPGGSYCRSCLSGNGLFADIGTDAYWWSSRSGSFFYNTNSLTTLRTRNIANINDGLSIRCVKD